MKFEDLSGQRFGRLVVLNEHELRSHAIYWLCQCDCGNKKFVRSNHMKSGVIRSCGCGKADASRTHGGANDKLYKVWKNMKSRCNTESAKEFKNYGGRGIRVCEEWEHNYEAFRDWAISNGYKDSLTIDRIDVNGNYEPSNCRWATRKEQQNNRRNNIFVVIDGKRKTLKEWCDIFGLNYDKVRRRYRKCGWSIEKAMTK